ncbi:hypothetical protein N8J89_35345 [Crossiella sp. CA-258035]|uniref:hypothetical protein n=1 Tax=Crossiella sp. CA-258035 TaxID=2981138 RepID=UPI0024BC105C|nr:hypothetical protein [Crossiella sp. CA-258035]WHT18333.1 hypothetical protein N8J89_35345 [Crossiella sp. CA-258035]
MTNWDAYSHEQIHKMINEGRGHYALSSRDLLWEKQAERLGRIGENVKKAFEGATGVMQGKSFDQMQERVSPAHQWATEASSMADLMRTTSSTSTNTFVDTQKKIEPAKQVTSSDNFISRGWASLTGGMTDKQQEQQDKDNAERKARETMRGYETTVLSSTSNLPTFVAPDPIDVGVGASGGGKSEVGNPVATPTRRGGNFDNSDPTRRGVLVGDRDGDGIPDDRDPVDDRNTNRDNNRPGDKDGDGIPDDRDPIDNTRNDDWHRNLPNDQVDPNRVIPSPVVNQPLPMNNPVPTPGPGGGGSTFGPVPVGGMPGGFGPGSGSGSAGMRPGFGPGGMGGIGSGGPGGPGSGFGPGGRGGAPGMGGGPMGGGARANGEEDKEHKRPDYLIETDDIFGEGTLVAPPVIGERPGL